MKSKVTAFINLPFGDNNYIIDDLGEYLDSIKEDNKLIINNVIFIPIALNNAVRLPVAIEQLETVKYYNYMKVEADNYKTAYYFIKSIDYAGDGMALFNLELDVLNTYNNLEFYPTTYVSREHVDRWDYNGLYFNKTTNKLFLLRKFSKEIEEEQPLNLIFNGIFAPDREKTKLIKNNYWFKVRLKDPDVGIKICYINYYLDFDVISDGKVITIKSFASYDAGHKNVFTQNGDNIFDSSVQPLPPDDALKNVGNGEIIDMANLPTYEIATLNIQIAGSSQIYTFLFLSTTYYLALIELPSAQLLLPKFTQKNYINSLTQLFYNILITKVENATRVIENLCDGFVLNNYFQNLINEEERTRDNFFYVNEPSVLNANYLNISLSFLQFQHRIIIENLELIDSDIFPDLCNNMETGSNFFNNFIISLGFELYSFKDGGVLWLEPGQYFNYNGYNGQGVPINWMGITPTVANNALNFEKEANLKKIEEETKKKEALIVKDDKSFFNKGIDWLKAQANIAQDFAKKSGVWSAVKKGIITFAHSGNLLKTAANAASAFLTEEEKKNNQTTTVSSFEEAIKKNDFKPTITINTIHKFETMQTVYYLTGNLVNCNKIPTHNNRVFFDFLQCQPVFKTNINANEDIKIELKKLFSDGVYYIHKAKRKDSTTGEFKSFWLFPESSNVENIETKLIEKIKDYIK